MRKFPNISIDRSIVHRIVRKVELTDHATIEPSENILSLSAEIKEMILKRIHAALRNDYRTFALNISDTAAHSFFAIGQALPG